MNTLGVPLGIFAAFVAGPPVGPQARPRRRPGHPAASPSRFRASASPSSRASPPTWPCDQLMCLFLGDGAAWSWCWPCCKHRRTGSPTTSTRSCSLGFVLLLSPHAARLVGQEINGSRIWLGIPGQLISFQPGELAKIAHRAVPGRLPGPEPRDAVHLHAGAAGPLRLPDFRTLLPLSAHVGRGAWSSSCSRRTWAARSCFFLVFLTMLYVATGKKLYLVVGQARWPP